MALADRQRIKVILELFDAPTPEAVQANLKQALTWNVFPEQYLRMAAYPGGPFHLYDPTTHCIFCASLMHGTREHKLAAFLHDVGKADTRTVDEDGDAHYYKHDEVGAEIARKWFYTFGETEVEAVANWSEAGVNVNRVCGWIRWHMFDMLHLHDKMIKRWLEEFDLPWIDTLFDLRHADWSAAKTEVCDFNDISRVHEQVHARVRAWREEEAKATALRAAGKAPTLKDLAVNGQDILSLGVDPGVVVGMTLAVLQSKVNKGELANTKEALMAEARQLTHTGGA